MVYANTKHQPLFLGCICMDRPTPQQGCQQFSIPEYYHVGCNSLHRYIRNPSEWRYFFLRIAVHDTETGLILVQDGGGQIMFSVVVHSSNWTNRCLQVRAAGPLQKLCLESANSEELELPHSKIQIFPLPHQNRAD